MLLDCPLAHEQRLGDGRVVPPRRHRLQDRPLLLGEPEQGRLRLVRLAGHQPLDHLRVEGRTTAGDLVQGAHQLVDLRDPLLQQVAQAGHAVLQQLEGVLLLDVLREDHDTDGGEVRADPLGRVDALGGERRGHPDVGEHRVRLELGHRLQQRLRVGERLDQVDLVELGHQRRHALAHEVVVVREHNPQGHDRTVAAR